MAQPQGQPMLSPVPPGQTASPEQMRQMQAQIAAEAQKAGLTVPEFIERLKAQAMQQHMQQQQQQQQQAAQQQQMQQQQQQVPIQPGPPKPEALALAKFLRSQELKMRTCILGDKRREMFKVKRALRAIESPGYEKLRAKHPELPPVTDRASLENIFKLLPLSMLALRVTKVDPHEGHEHAKKKRVKGQWTVKIEPQQDANDEYYYAWMWEGPQWKNRLMAGGALLLILAVVFFPLWPYHLRLGVWYLSMGMLGLLGLFFAMAIFRLILFLVTFFTVKPGLWLYPNLFEDVGFFDSFKPVWAWHEDDAAVKARKKSERQQKKEKRAAKANKSANKNTAASTAVEATQQEGAVVHRHQAPAVEEVEE